MSMPDALPKLLLGIIGHPLGHSLSPRLHTWAMRRMNVDGAYYSWPLMPARLADFVAAVRVLPVHGVSVTIPHKEAVMPLLDGFSDTAKAVGALNTLYWRDGRLLGENTDIIGFKRPLESLDRMPSTALVLGSGGAARAVVAGLVGLGLERIVIANRDASRAIRVAGEFGVEHVSWEDRTSVRAELLVNTTPLGMQGKNESLSPWPADAFEPGQIAYDLVYNPLRTLFLRQAEAAGCRVVTGSEMFLNQANEQFRLWTGLSFPLDEARQVLSGLLAG